MLHPKETTNPCELRILVEFVIEYWSHYLIALLVLYKRGRRIDKFIVRSFNWYEKDILKKKGKLYA